MELPVLDWRLADHLAGDNHEQARELLSLLLDHLPKHQEALEIAYQQKDFPAFKVALHGLAGALCYCGTPRLQNILKTLHQRLKGISTQDFSAVDQLFHLLLEEMNNLKVEAEQSLLLKNDAQTN